MKLLFVCTGNICRSPTAEAVMQHLLEQQQLKQHFTLDSAGTQSHHVGEQADPRTRKVATAKGIAIDHLRARQLTQQDFAEFDLLLAMDKSHYHWMRTMGPQEHIGKVQLYLPYAGIAAPQEVPDPYYGEMEDFEAVLELIEQASAQLLPRLLQTNT